VIKKSIFYWSPFIDHVGTTISSRNSITSLKKFGKKKFSVTVINVFGEWDEYKDFLGKINVNIVNLNLKKGLPLFKNNGFIFSRIFYFKIFFLCFIPLFKILKNKKPDYLIVSLITFLPLTLNFFFSFKTKIIMRISGFPKLNFMRFYFWKFMFSKVEWIFSPTQITNELLKKKFKNFDRKFKLLRDPIFSYSDLRDIKRKSKKVKKENFYLSVGRLTKQKNFEFLIRGVSEYNKTNEKKIKVIVIGEGEDKNKLINLTKTLKIEEYIKFLGFKKDVFEYFLNAKALICTSLWEDPGFVLIEAGIANLPVISNACKSGPIEILKHKENGYLYLYNSMDDFLKKIKDFECENPKTINQKIIMMKKFSRNFSIFKFYKNFTKYV
tara:strand:+ start:7113 stop:8258 length:1146 start_codon:yes stop_codon:yes gene_type:complete